MSFEFGDLITPDSKAVYFVLGVAETEGMVMDEMDTWDFSPGYLLVIQFRGNPGADFVGLGDALTPPAVSNLYELWEPPDGVR